MLKTLVTSFLIISSACFSQIKSKLSNRGTPIFIEDFGNSTTGANKSDIGSTSYNYVINKTPPDGSYLISSSFRWYKPWFNTQDHTPNDNQGKALIVNADRNRAGIFFSRKINGLCPSSTYEFSTWLLNISSSDFPECKIKTGIPGGIPIDVRFEIWDKTNTVLIKSITTGKIYSKNYPEWNRYGIIFKTLPNQDSAILKIANNGQGGCGNDLAIDDIQFSYFGDSVEVSSNTNKESPIQLCSNYRKGIQLKATTQKKYFNKTYFQWQLSLDGKTYKNIQNQQSEALNIPTPKKAGKYYYRVKIAESESSFTNPYCNIASEPFIFDIYSSPRLYKKLPIFQFKETDLIKISISKYTNATKIKWYDSEDTNGKIISSTKVFKPTNFPIGHHTIFAKLSTSHCYSSKKTPVTFNITGTPIVVEPIEEIKEPIELPKAEIILTADTF